MRILVLSYLFPNGREPIKGKFVYEQLAALPRQTSILVIAPIPFAPTTHRWRGIPVYERIANMTVCHPRFFALPGNKFQWITGIFYALAVVLLGLHVRRTYRPDVIHAHTTFYDGLPGAVLSRLTRTRLIVTAHGSDMRFWTNFLPIRAFTAYVLKQASKVVSPHPEVTRILASWVDSERIVEIPNGVDTRKYNVLEPEAISALRRSLRLSQTTVVFVAGLTEFKDPITFVRAAALVQKEVPEASFVVVGDGPLRTAVQRESKSLRLCDRIIFLGLRTDVEKLLHLGRIFTALSPVENLWSTSLVEAMAAGRACVVAESGTAREMRGNLDQLFVFVRPKDAEAVARAIVQLIRNPEQQLRIGAAAREYACTHFALESVSRRVMCLYVDAVAQNSD